ncbi:uncharacterized protein LOC110841276 [Zootermopsis nevadensis]|uniref:Uncharacterized protein n=1 Tax=Zootermopsis nevadensis TaxID=136037 RepID=A0A067RH08_ZOONE|nr:uncharacterized protein LOC110841276 [Zootermopsis nevadensis]KDR23062.1 hypothetical protein L798_10925 [Zootermopsis nevadensis]
MSADNNTVTPVKKNFKAFALKMHRIKKILKPVMKLLHKQCHRFEAREQHIPAPQSTTVKPQLTDESETFQNSANEALESRLRDDLIQKSEEAGGVIGVWVEGRMTLIPVTRGRQHIPVPVHFACTPSGDFAWTPLPDSDVWWRGGVQTTGQTAEEQVPSSRKIELE